MGADEILDLLSRKAMANLIHPQNILPGHFLLLLLPGQFILKASAPPLPVQGLLVQHGESGELHTLCHLRQLLRLLLRLPVGAQMVQKLHQQAVTLSLIA